MESTTVYYNIWWNSLYGEIVNNCTVHISQVLAQKSIIITLNDCVHRNLSIFISFKKIENVIQKCLFTLL